MATSACSATGPPIELTSCCLAIDLPFVVGARISELKCFTRSKTRINHQICSRDSACCCIGGDVLWSRRRAVRLSGSENRTEIVVSESR